MHYWLSQYIISAYATNSGTAMRFLLLCLSLISFLSFAAPVSVTVSGTTLCNNGTIERTVAGTMTTTCGAGWSVGALPVEGAILFAENFDAQPDWYSGVTAGSPVLSSIPVNWDSGYSNEEWHPDDGFPGTQPVMQINGNNTDQVYGGTGKAFIFSNESFDSNNWNSDGFIIKDFAASTEVYVKFNMKFQTSFADTRGALDQDIIKIFRITSWDAPESGLRTPFFEDGVAAPIYIHDWIHNDFGIRHSHAMRCDDQLTNYFCTTPEIINSPFGVSGGSFSSNYTNQITYLSPVLPDLVNGGNLPTSGTIWHNQVLGDIWHTVEAYVSLNSAAGVQDGTLKFWLDGQPIVDFTGIAWIGTNGDMNAKWNSIAFGGNNLYKFDLVGTPAERERWYAIDNIEIRNGLPAELQ